MLKFFWEGVKREDELRKVVRNGKEKFQLQEVEIIVKDAASSLFIIVSIFRMQKIQIIFHSLCEKCA